MCLCSEREWVFSFYKYSLNSFLDFQEVRDAEEFNQRGEKLQVWNSRMD